MPFRSVFIAIVIAFGLIMAGYLVNRQRPALETDRPTLSLVRASGAADGQRRRRRSEG
jgi:hypothetical protein